MLQKGFTLIELLVVITIIGILATGAVTVFTSQIQKARDTTRIGDIKAIQGAVEQSFQDKFSYPTPAALIAASTGTIDSYMQSRPQDPAFNQPNCTNSGGTASINCDYIYAVNGTTITGYEISAVFENKNNARSKAINTADGGNDNDRFEVGTLKDRAGTAISSSSATTTATATGVLIRR